MTYQPKPATLTLLPADWAAFRTYALRQGWPYSTLLRKAVETYIATAPTRDNILEWTGEKPGGRTQLHAHLEWQDAEARALAASAQVPLAVLVRAAVRWYISNTSPSDTTRMSNPWRRQIRRTGGRPRKDKTRSFETYDTK